MAIHRLKPKGLAFKLSLSILSALILLFAGIIYYNYHFSKRLLLESAREVAEQLTKATENRMESVLTSAERVPEGLKLYLQHSGVNEQSVKEMLKFVLKNKPEVFGSAIAFAPYAFSPETESFSPYCYRSGDDYLYKNLSDENYRYFDQDWYALAREKDRAVWTEPYFDEGGGNVLMATYASPFFYGEGSNRTFSGVATADLSLNWLEDMMNALKVLESGYVILVSEKGTIITHPVRQFQMQNLVELAKRSGNEEMIKIVGQIFENKEGFMPFTALTDQRPGWIYYTSLPQTNWHMIVFFPEKELFAGLHQLYFYTIFIGLLGIALLSLMVILLSSQITKPLRRLTLTANEIGAGNFDVQIKEDNSTSEIYMLGTALSRMQLELKDYIRNLKTTTAVKERFESELNIAHTIQQGMIPKTFPPYPERKDIDIYALLEPARQVGGDLYDFFFLDEDTLCFAIGDVSDKGVPASLMMAMTITLFRAKTNIDQAVNEMAASINHEISKGNENMMFVTFFMGILKMKTGELKYCNAGHNYPFLLKKDGSLELLEETHGVPFGIKVNQVYRSGETRLEKHDILVLYTDGISEALNLDGNFYGEERLMDLVQNNCQGLDPEQISLKIMKDVGEFANTPERSDDITLMVLSFYPEDKN